MENAVAGFFPGAAPSMAAGHLTAGEPFALAASSARRAPSSLPTASSRCSLVYLPAASASRARFSLPTAACSTAFSCHGRTGSASEGAAYRVVPCGVRAASFGGAESSTGVLYTAIGDEGRISCCACNCTFACVASATRASALSASSPVILAKVDVSSATELYPFPSCRACILRAGPLKKAAVLSLSMKDDADALYTATGAVFSCSCGPPFVGLASAIGPAASTSSPSATKADALCTATGASARILSCACGCPCLLSATEVASISAPPPTCAVSAARTEADVLYTATSAGGRVYSCACDCRFARLASPAKASLLSATSHGFPVSVTEAEIWSATEPAPNPSPSFSPCLVRTALASEVTRSASASSPFATKAGALYTATGASARILPFGTASAYPKTSGTGLAFLSTASSLASARRYATRCSAARCDESSTMPFQDWDRLVKVSVLCLIVQKALQATVVQAAPSVPAIRDVKAAEIEWKAVGRIFSILACLMVGYSSAAKNNKNMDLVVKVLDSSMKCYKFVEAVSKLW